MIPLVAKGTSLNITQTLVGIFMRNPSKDNSGYVVKCKGNTLNVEDAICVLVQDMAELNIDQTVDIPVVYGVNTLSHLFDGDIVAINPSGLVNTLFRVKSEHNALFITDRCNSNCLMCSQPPKNKDDLDYHYSLNRHLINLIPKETEVIGITGGEPTILGGRLSELLELLYTELPNTAVHMLSNGRIFAWKKYSQRLLIANKNLIIGIPLYSDNYLDHDYIVQAKDAFNQTVIGLHNLARYDVKLEIRVVLHKLTFERLPEMARFIYKTFPFVSHIAFMGLEYIGYTPYNHEKLWIEPSKYMAELEDATLFLDCVGMNVSIYNLQHCLLKESLWNFSRKSISDWKRDYIDECAKCKKLKDCGGVFSTSKMLSNEIKAISL